MPFRFAPAKGGGVPAAGWIRSSTFTASMTAWPCVPIEYRLRVPPRPDLSGAATAGRGDTA